MIGADGNGVAYTYHADGSLAKVSPATGSSTAFTVAGADAEYEQKAKTILSMELSYALGGDAKDYAASLMERVSVGVCTL